MKRSVCAMKRGGGVTRGAPAVTRIGCHALETSLAVSAYPSTIADSPYLLLTEPGRAKKIAGLSGDQGAAIV